MKRSAAETIDRVLLEALAERRRRPRDDLLTYLLGCRVDGEPLSETLLLDTAFTLYLAGIETTAATLGYMFRHLANEPETRSVVTTRPQLVPELVDEFVRLYSILAPTRLATRDAVVEG